MRRIEEGYCTVFNPFNRNQVSYVSLKPRDVDVIVFWTKNAQKLLPDLKKLTDLGYRYYFQYTINGYPGELEKNTPELDDAINTFQELSQLIGYEKVIWRYDPVIISNITDYAFHKENFHYIARCLRGSTKRVVISVVDHYRKAIYNFKKLKKQGIEINLEPLGPEFDDLMRSMAATARENGMEIFSCAEEFDLSKYGIQPGKCIDDRLIKHVFGIDVTSQKDKSQRKECGCVQSKDIGIYDTCLHGCAYCYAGTNNAAQNNYQGHFPDSPSLLGRYHAAEPEEAPSGSKGVQMKFDFECGDDK